MKHVFVVAFPDGKYLDKDGEYSSFFFAKTFETYAIAYTFACDNLEFGIHFRIDTFHVQTIA